MKFKDILVIRTLNTNIKIRFSFANLIFNWFLPLKKINYVLTGVIVTASFFYQPIYIFIGYFVTCNFLCELFSLHVSTKSWKILFRI